MRIKINCSDIGFLFIEPEGTCFELQKNDIVEVIEGEKEDFTIEMELYKGKTSICIWYEDTDTTFLINDRIIDKIMGTFLT